MAIVGFVETVFVYLDDAALDIEYSPFHLNECNRKFNKIWIAMTVFLQNKPINVRGELD